MTTQFDTPAVIDEKYNKLKSSFSTGLTLDLEFRREQLRNLYWAIVNEEPALSEALFKDLHRAKEESEVIEINAIVTEVLTAIRNLSDWAADEKISADPRFALGTNLLKKEPYGVVLVVGPWNYPLLCTLVPMISAIAAGNVVLVKPSEIAENTAKVLSAILSSVDPRVVQLVNAGVEGTTHVLKHKFDKIMFTGSNRVGQIIQKAAAEQPIATPLTLELGGKSPAIVFASADLPLAAKRLAWAKFTNAGQTCIAPDYCIIEKSIAPKFIELLKAATEEMYPNLSSTNDRDFAHIITDRMFDRLSSLIEKSNGKKWQLGTPNRETKFLPPTIVGGVMKSDSLMSEELFGPILPIYEVPDNTVNSETRKLVCGGEHDYPLACYVFSQKESEIDGILDHIRTGAVMVNDALVQGGSTGIPFGGVGGSGMGRYHGKWGFDEFTHEKPVIYQPKFVEMLLKYRYPPFTSRNAFIVRLLSRPSAWWLSKSGKVSGLLYTIDQFLLKIGKLSFSQWALILLVLYIVRNY